MADDFGQGVGIDAVGDDVIGGQQEFQLVRLGLLQKILGELDLVFFDQRLADGFTLRLEEGVGHAAADDEHVDFAEQVLDDADFVADFGAAEDGDEGALGILKGAAEILKFFLHEQPGGGFLNKFGDADGGGMGAVRGAERVIDVEVSELARVVWKNFRRWLLLRRGSAGFRAGEPGPFRV